MLKLYKELVGKILLALTYLGDAQRAYGIATNGNRIRENALDNWTRTRPGDPPNRAKVIEAVMNILNHADEDSYDKWLDLENIVSELASVLNQSGKDQGDLVDIIVKVLKLEHAHNTLSGKTLTMLRQAILLPDEMAALNERLRHREQSCTNCGNEFVAGDVVTVGRDMSMQMIYLCINCSSPRTVACATNKCGEHAYLSKNTIKTLTSGKCPECVSKDKKASIGNKIPGDEVADAVMNDGEPRVRMVADEADVVHMPHGIPRVAMIDEQAPMPAAAEFDEQMERWQRGLGTRPRVRQPAPVWNPFADPPVQREDNLAPAGHIGQIVRAEEPVWRAEPPLANGQGLVVNWEPAPQAIDRDMAGNPMLVRNPDEPAMIRPAEPRAWVNEIVDRARRRRNRGNPNEPR